MQDRLKTIKNRRGNTLPLALAMMLLLLALGGSILLVAAYRYQNAGVRKAQNQLYLYATSVVDKFGDEITGGDFNRILSDSVDKVKLSGADLENYAKEYNFRYTLGNNIAGEPYIKNDFTNQNISLVCKVKLSPISPGTPIAADTKEYIQIGDQMKIEYQIGMKDYEYRITANYICNKDTNRGPDGSIVATDQYTNMKWVLDKYTGKLYNR